MIRFKNKVIPIFFDPHTQKKTLGNIIKAGQIFQIEHLSEQRITGKKITFKNVYNSRTENRREMKFFEH